MIPTSWIVGLVSNACLFSVGFIAGCNHGEDTIQTKWDKYQLIVDQAAEQARVQRIVENRAIKAVQKETNDIITKQHQKEVAEITARVSAAERLRVGKAFCGGPRTAPETIAASTSHSDATDTGSRVVSEDTQRAINSLIIEVESGLATGRACQQFVKDNGLTAPS